MTTRDVRWRQFFQVAAAYNLAVGLPFLFFEDQLRDLLGMRPPDYRVFTQMLFAFVALLGVAYWRVAQDLDAGRDLVRLGLAAKLVAFVLCVGHAAAGNIPVLLALPGVGDLAFAVGFSRFLHERCGG